MSENVPNVSSNKGGEVILNSPPKSLINPAIKWCFTFNNYIVLDVPKYTEILKEKCTKFIFQFETGENGTPHLQGAIWLKKRCRGSEVGLPKGVHWEKMISERDSIIYCSKLESRDKGTVPVCHNIKLIVPIQIITNLRPWQVEAEKYCLAEPDGRTVKWYHEDIGGLGKSSFCKYMYVKHNALIIQGGKLADIMNIIFNADMDQIRCVIIDIPRNNGNSISYTAIECILNGMITNTKYETGIKCFNPPNVCVLANREPDLSKLSKDRWDVVDLRATEEPIDDCLAWDDNLVS